MYHKTKDSGFTLIELMLSMIFVAFILVFISLTLVQMFRTYDKGSSMKQVNQAGRSIIEEISQAVRSQLPANINTNAVSNGVLCIDNVMYVWNPLYIGTAPLDTSAPANRAVIGNTVTGGTMARKVLQNAALGCPADLSTALTRPVTQESQLLTSQTRVLRSSATRLDAHLIKLDFVIGTYSRSEIVGNTTKYLTATRQSDGSFSCLTGNEGDYCSFAEFSTIVYLSKDQ